MNCDKKSKVWRGDVEVLKGKEEASRAAILQSANIVVEIEERRGLQGGMHGGTQETQRVCDSLGVSETPVVRTHAEVQEEVSVTTQLQPLPSTSNIQRPFRH